MLTDSAILKLIKRRVQAPFQYLELTDDEILDHLKETVLDDFSDYVPYEKYKFIGIDEEDNKVDETTFRIIDPDDDEIMWVTSVLFSNRSILYGHPLFGPMNYDSLPDWYLKAYTARTTMFHGMDSNTYEFIPPNLVRLYNHQSDFVAVYACKYPSFLATPYKFNKLIKDMCIAETKILIGGIRTRVEGLETPYGTITLDGAKLQDEGTTLRERCEEKLQLIPPRRSVRTDVQ